MTNNRYITDRQEIAYAMNFGKFPVLSLNRENIPFSDSNYCIGSKCRVAWDRKEPRYEGMTTHGHVYLENGRYAISGFGACLKASFGYSDVMKMLEEANAPIVHRGQTVVLVEQFPSCDSCTVSVMKVSDRIDINCSTVATLVELTDEESMKWEEEYKDWKRRTY